MPNQQQGFRGRDRTRLRPAREPAAEILSWTQPRDKPEWVGRTVAVVGVYPRRSVVGARMVAPVPSWVAPACRPRRSGVRRPREGTQRSGLAHTSGVG